MPQRVVSLIPSRAMWRVWIGLDHYLEHLAVLITLLTDGFLGLFQKQRTPPTHPTDLGLQKFFLTPSFMQMPWLQRNVGEGKASGCSEKSGRSITGVTFFRHRETPRQEMGWLVDTKISLLILLPKWYFRKSKSMWHCDDRAPHFLSNHEVGGYCRCVPDVPSYLH